MKAQQARHSPKASEDIAKRTTGSSQPYCVDLKAAGKANRLKDLQAISPSGEQKAAESTQNGMTGMRRSLQPLLKKTGQSGTVHTYKIRKLSTTLGAKDTHKKY